MYVVKYLLLHTFWHDDLGTSRHCEWLFHTTWSRGYSGWYFRFGLWLSVFHCGFQKLQGWILQCLLFEFIELPFWYMYAICFKPVRENTVCLIQKECSRQGVVMELGAAKNCDQHFSSVDCLLKPLMHRRQDINSSCRSSAPIPSNDWDIYRLFWAEVL